MPIYIEPPTKRRKQKVGPIHLKESNSGLWMRIIFSIIGLIILLTFLNR